MVVVTVGQRTYRSVARTRRHRRGSQLVAGPEGGRLYSRGGAGKTLRQTLNTLRAFQLPADDRSWGSVEGRVRMFGRRPAGRPLPQANSPVLPQHVPLGPRTSLGYHERVFGMRIVEGELSCEGDGRGILGLGRSPHPITLASPNTIALDSV